MLTKSSGNLEPNHVVVLEGCTNKIKCVDTRAMLYAPNYRWHKQILNIFELHFILEIHVHVLEVYMDLSQPVFLLQRALQ